MHERPRGILSRIKRSIHLATGDYSSPPPYQPSPADLKTTADTLDMLRNRGQIDVKPIQDLLKNPDAFGLDEDKVRTSRMVLSALSQRPTVDHLSADEILWALHQEEQFAKPNEERYLQQRASRRRFLRMAGVGAGVISAVGTGLVGVNSVYNFIYERNYSPEALEKERQRKIEFEKSNVLGVSFSSESTAGWRIRHPEASDDRYREVEVRNLTTNGSSSERDIVWSSGGLFGERPAVRIDNYQTSQGNERAVLRVRVAGTADSGTYESWLPSTPNPILNHDLIHFQHRPTGRDKYLQITKPLGTREVYTVKVLVKDP